MLTLDVYSKYLRIDTNLQWSAFLKEIPSLRSEKYDLAAVYQFTGELELNELHGYVILFLKNIKKCIKDLHHAFECDDFEKIKVVAHNMKSASLYIGAQKLSDSCRDLEDSTMTIPLEPQLVKLAGEHAQSELNEVVNLLETWSQSVKEYKK